jgi:DNA-binding response OmpR family regulator
VRRFFSRRKDVVLECTQAISDGADINVIPAPMLDRVTEDEAIRLPILVYGSHIFLRRAFLAGCADYCKEPWTLDELEARLDRIIASVTRGYDFPWGKLGFSGRDASVSGTGLGLTYQELRILRVLVEQRGNVVPREALFYSLWGNPGSASSRIVDVHVSSLRKKIARAVPGLGGTSVISSVRNIGYIIT